MRNDRVKYMIKALGLERNIVGVKFLTYRHEYELCEAEKVENRGTFCYFVNKASRGRDIKIKRDNVSCGGGAISVGLVDEQEGLTQGFVEHCGLYESEAVAREVANNMVHLEQKKFGIRIAPLELMDNADIVIILGNAKQIMRIVQGYTYHYGVAKNFTAVGNKAICSELCAKPFVKNDLCISFMCFGARASTQCLDGELGVGMPIQMFAPLADGVVQTLNLVETNKEKNRILERLNFPEELGIEIIMNTNYGKLAGEYITKAREIENKYIEE